MALPAVERLGRHLVQESHLKLIDTVKSSLCRGGRFLSDGGRGRESRASCHLGLRHCRSRGSYGRSVTSQCRATKCERKSSVGIGPGGLLAGYSCGQLTTLYQHAGR